MSWTVRTDHTWYQLDALIGRLILAWHSKHEQNIVFNWAKDYDWVMSTRPPDRGKMLERLVGLDFRSRRGSRGPRPELYQFGRDLYDNIRSYPANYVRLPLEGITDQALDACAEAVLVTAEWLVRSRLMLPSALARKSL
jgi:hypothetical protein